MRIDFDKFWKVALAFVITVTAFVMLAEGIKTQLPQLEWWQYVGGGLVLLVLIKPLVSKKK
ncbi:MAG: hypothetical protein ACE5DI_01290 [Candidatus Micrarchaeia archaeon]